MQNLGQSQTWYMTHLPLRMGRWREALKNVSGTHVIGWHGSLTSPPRSVHHQDHTASIFELPPALEDNTRLRNARNVCVSLIMVRWDKSPTIGTHSPVLASMPSPCFNGMVQCANRPRGDTMLMWIVLGGSQLGHFAAASLIRSTYLCSVFSFVWKRNIKRSSHSVNTEPSVCLMDYMPLSSLTGLAPVRYSFGPLWHLHVMN